MALQPLATWQEKRVPRGRFAREIVACRPLRPIKWGTKGGLTTAHAVTCCCSSPICSPLTGCQRPELGVIDREHSAPTSCPVGTCTCPRPPGTRRCRMALRSHKLGRYHQEMLLHAVTAFRACREMPIWHRAAGRERWLVGCKQRSAITRNRKAVEPLCHGQRPSAMKCLRRRPSIP